MGVARCFRPAAGAKSYWPPRGNRRWIKQNLQLHLLRQRRPAMQSLLSEEPRCFWSGVSLIKSRPD
jgi:hypothetical protein